MRRTHVGLVTLLLLSVGASVACEVQREPNTAGGGGTAGGGESSGGTTQSSGGSVPSTSGGGTSASGGSTGGSGGVINNYFGESRCAQGNFLLCDGFEGDSIDSSTWTLQKAGSNTIELTTAESARGSKSVHLHTQTDKYAFLKTTKIFPVATNNYYGRMFLRVARFSKVDWAHWTVVEAAGTGDGSLIRVGGQYRTDLTKNRWGIGSDGGPTGDWTTHDNDPTDAPVEPATAEWHCVEWAHLGSTNETHFYLNGEEHPSLATTSSQHGGNAVPYVMPNFTSVWFGWYQYQSDPEAFDVWIDEVALDDTRIGCTL